LVDGEADRFPLSFTLTCLLLALGVAVFGVRRAYFGYFAGATIVVIVTALAVNIAHSMQGSRSSLARRIVEIEAGKPARPGSELADATRRVLRTVVPSLSGRATVLVVISCFALSATLLSAALKLPRFVETEAVLASWWLTLSVTLTVLLYRGFRMGDDYRFVVRKPSFVKAIKGTDSPSLRKLADLGVQGALDLEGCALLIVSIGTAILALSASWLLTELLFPLLFLVVYRLLHGALARVANDVHACAGDALRSVRWGVCWAAAYSVS
jgi:hypothetical protein